VAGKKGFFLQDKKRTTLQTEQAKPSPGVRPESGWVPVFFHGGLRRAFEREKEKTELPHVPRAAETSCVHEGPWLVISKKLTGKDWRGREGGHSADAGPCTSRKDKYDRPVSTNTTTGGE